MIIELDTIIEDTSEQLNHQARAIQHKTVTAAIMSDSSSQPLLRQDKPVPKHAPSPPRGRSRIIRLVKKAIIIYGLVLAVFVVIGFNILIAILVKDAFIATRLVDRVGCGILAPFFFGFQLIPLYLWLEDMQEGKH